MMLTPWGRRARDRNFALLYIGHLQRLRFESPGPVRSFQRKFIRMMLLGR